MTHAIAAPSYTDVITEFPSITAAFRLPTTPGNHRRLNSRTHKGRPQQCNNQPTVVQNTLSTFLPLSLLQRTETRADMVTYLP